MSTQRLYPPYIEGKLPAQTNASIFKVPFTMNRAVGYNDISGFRVKIRSIFTDKTVAIENGVRGAGELAEYAIFQLEGKLKQGQYYKVQLAYLDQGGIEGYYSTVGIVKYTGQPSVQIDGFTANSTTVQPSKEIYIGKYTHPANDPSEKEYSYRFQIQEEGRIIYDSGELLHDLDSDGDTLVAPILLNPKEQCVLIYSVTTVNGIIVSARNIVEGQSEDPELPVGGTISAVCSFDEAYIQLIMKFDYEIDSKQYKLWRYNEDTKQQLLLGKMTIKNIQADDTIIIYKDYEVEQGVKYSYTLQATNDAGVVGKKATTQTVFVDFEDMYLYDGERQLKLRFDPKISSFKTTILEQKIDTLGGTYPLFFRNGNTYYKEFPISALISMLMDDNEQFYSWRDEVNDVRNTTIAGANDIVADNSTNLTAKNIKKEREFKLAVLDWLNNGEIKLFKSPTEGNYMVRLTNISLSPNDTLGRMIHTLSAQAYEMSNKDSNVLRDKSFAAIISPTTYAYKYLHDKDDKRLQDNTQRFLIYEDTAYVR